MCDQEWISGRQFIVTSPVMITKSLSEELMQDKRVEAQFR